MKICGEFTGGPVTISVGKDCVYAACSRCGRSQSATPRESFERLMARLGCGHGVGSFQGKPVEGQALSGFIAPRETLHWRRY